MRDQNTHNKQQKQILSFHDEGEAMEHRMFLPNDKFRNQLQDMAMGDVLHHEIVNYLERMCHHLNFTYTNAQDMWTSIITPPVLKPEDVLFGIANISEKISGFFAISCEIHYTFKFNISPMGAGIVWIGQKYDEYDGRTDIIDDPILSSPLGTWVNLNTTRTHTEIVKYNSSSPWFGLTTGFEYGSWPRVYAKAAVPYRNPNSENLSGSIFVCLRNVKVRYPTVKPLQAPPSESSMVKQIKELNKKLDMLKVHERTDQQVYLLYDEFNKSNQPKFEVQIDDQEDEINEGLISKTIVKVKETAHVIDEIVPNVIPIDSITQVADLALDICKVAGFSKPFGSDMPVVADIGTNKGMNNLDGTIAGYQMGDFNGTLLPIGPAGADKYDEMNISSFTSRECFFTGFQITATQNPGDAIWKQHVSPGIFQVLRPPVAPYANWHAMTPLTLAAQFFKYWHGDLTFKFLIAKNAMQNFSIRIYYLAGVMNSEIPANGFDYTKAPSKVYDCGDVTEIEFTCSFNAHETWKTNAFDETDIRKETVTGSIMVELVNKLTTTAAVSNVIDVLVLVYSKNMQFNVTKPVAFYPGVVIQPTFEVQSDGNTPITNPTPKPLMPATDKTPSLVKNIPTVKEGGMGETLTNKQTTTEQITYAPTMSNGINVLTMGQRITSFKQLMQRDFIIDTSTLTTGGDTVISFTPYYLHPVTSVATPAVRKSDPISIISRCFTFASGAINTRVVLLNDDSVSGAFAQIVFDINGLFSDMPSDQGGFHYTQAVTPEMESFFTGTMPQVVVQRTMQQAINIQAPNYLINQLYRTDGVEVPGMLHILYRNVANNGRFYIFRSIADNFQLHTYKGTPPMTIDTTYISVFPYTA